MKKKTTYSFDKEDIELLKKPLINPCNECSSKPCGWWCQDRIRYEEKEKLYKERNVLELAEQLAELESLKSEIAELEIKIAHMKNDYEKRKNELQEKGLVDANGNFVEVNSIEVNE